jgi:hypothetical protein
MNREKLIEIIERSEIYQDASQWRYAPKHREADMKRAVNMLADLILKELPLTEPPAVGRQNASEGSANGVQIPTVPLTAEGVEKLLPKLRVLDNPHEPRVRDDNYNQGYNEAIIACKKALLTHQNRKGDE